MRKTLQLTAEESEELLAMMERTDSENEAIGVSGAEVAEYNIRVLRLQSLRRQLETREAEHAAHPVTLKIAAYQGRKNPTKSLDERAGSAL